MNGNLVLSQPKNLEINQPSIWVWTSTWGFFEAIFTAWLRHAAFEDSVIRCSPILMEDWLVVSTPLKNISQNGNLPQVRMNMKNIWNHHLEEILAIFRWKLFLSFKFENWGRELGTGHFSMARWHNDSIISYMKNRRSSPGLSCEKTLSCSAMSALGHLSEVGTTAQWQGRQKHTSNTSWSLVNRVGFGCSSLVSFQVVPSPKKKWHVQHLRCKYVCVCIFLW